jgi:peptidoglycan/xylan/chitin deacetylase (PgdA/CDA1 family)
MRSGSTYFTIKHFAGEVAWTTYSAAARLLCPGLARQESAIRSVRTKSRLVALTFDDGPSEASLRVAELLARRGDKGTFFVCGRNAERRPKELRELASAGHEIGNHTYSHREMYFSRASQIHGELSRTQDVIESVTGVRPNLFRPPYGSRWFNLKRIEEGLALRRVLWDIDSQDWKLLPSPEIADRVVQNAGPGRIVLLHDGKGIDPTPSVDDTVAAVDLILNRLSSMGYQSVTVSELLRHATEGNAASRADS